MPTFFRHLPSLNELLDAPPLKQLIETANRQTVVVSAKKFLSGLEAEVRSAAATVPVPNVRELAGQIARWIAEGQPPRSRPIINATGDILNPELSPPPLAKEAIAAMQVAAAGYVRADAAGPESPRAAAEKLLCELTGAEAAIVVHSQPAALLLALAGASSRGEVIVSRGDLVQSPRGARISDIAQAAGARLHEIGAVNSTSAADYENAFAGGAKSALSIRWTQVSQGVGLSELADAARRKNVSLIADLGGSGLVDLSAYGVPRMPIAAAVKSQADLLTFSTCELIGGPPSGAIVGKKTAIDLLRRLPLAASLQPNAITVAGLLATLELYQQPARAMEAIPVLSLLSTSPTNLQYRSERIAGQLKTLSALESVEIAPSEAPLWGNAIISHAIPSHGVQILAKNASAEFILGQLASAEQSILAKSCKGKLCIDLRSVFPDQDEQIVAAFESILGSSTP